MNLLSVAVSVLKLIFCTLQEKNTIDLNILWNELNLKHVYF